MNRLQKELASRFDGSLEDAEEILSNCRIALETMKKVEERYSELEDTDGHMRNRKGLVAASADILYFGIKPLEAKFPELKKE